MRKITTMAAALMLMVVLSAGAAFATSEPVPLFSGTAGDDLIRGTAKDDTIKGLAGDDALHGLGGDDTLYGGRGHDGLYGGAGIDVIHGGMGDDRAEERKVFGGSGGDVIYGEGGKDALYGGPGDDLVISTGDDAGDFVDCGDGVDSVRKGSDQGLDRFVDCEKFFR